MPELITITTVITITKQIIITFITTTIMTKIVIMK